MNFDLSLPLNMAILGNPMNWLIIVLILLLVSFSAFTISQNAGALTPKI